jgi:alkylation response protein AidB-like acyl-CoA dehydrogenase
MHTCATSVITAMGSPELRRRYLPRIASGELTVAYAGTERSTGTNFWALESAAVKVERGWYLRLRKEWATLAEVADLFVVPTRASPAAAPDEISLFLVERGLGVESREAWRGTGMRGSTSGPVEIDAVVEDGALMGPPGRANEYITTEMFNLLLLSHAALYSGVADEALALAVEHANQRSFGHTAELLGEMSLWQSRLGELSAELAACRALIRETARAVETDTGERRLLKEALAAKLTACGAARRATDLALQISGGSGYNVGRRVEMLWRDARAGSLMRPSDEVAQILLGRTELGQKAFEV